MPNPLMRALQIRTEAEGLDLHDLGGRGSGNFGHSGRPGEQGGSGDSGGKSETPRGSRAAHHEAVRLNEAAAAAHLAAAKVYERAGETTIPKASETDTAAKASKAAVEGSKHAFKEVRTMIARDSMEGVYIAHATARGIQGRAAYQPASSAKRDHLDAAKYHQNMADFHKVLLDWKKVK